MTEVGFPLNKMIVEQDGFFLVEATKEQGMATLVGRRAFGRKQAASPLVTDTIGA